VCGVCVCESVRESVCGVVCVCVRERERVCGVCEVYKREVSSRKNFTLALLMHKLNLNSQPPTPLKKY